MFISVEGIEAAGKTSFCQGLVNSLRNSGYKAFYTADPAHTAISMQVRKFICNNEIPSISTLMLVSGARSHHYHTEIKPRLEDGCIVVTDRYVLTSFVYHREKCGLNTVKELHNMGCESLYPYFNFVIDVPVEVALNRLEQREKLTVFDVVGAETLNRWRYDFLECGKYLPISYPDPIILDGTAPIHELVEDQVEQLVEYFTDRNKAGDDSLDSELRAMEPNEIV